MRIAGLVDTQDWDAITGVMVQKKPYLHAIKVVSWTPKIQCEEGLFELKGATVSSVFDDDSYAPYFSDRFKRVLTECWKMSLKGYLGVGVDISQGRRLLEIMRIVGLPDPKGVDFARDWGDIDLTEERKQEIVTGYGVDRFQFYAMNEFYDGLGFIGPSGEVGSYF